MNQLKVQECLALFLQLFSKAEIIYHNEKFINHYDGNAPPRSLRVDLGKQKGGFSPGGTCLGHLS